MVSDLFTNICKALAEVDGLTDQGLSNALSEYNNHHFVHGDLGFTLKLSEAAEDQRWINLDFEPTGNFDLARENWQQVVEVLEKIRGIFFTTNRSNVRIERTIYCAGKCTIAERIYEGLYSQAC